MLNPTGCVPVGFILIPKFQHGFLVQGLGNYRQSFKDRPLAHRHLKLQSISTKSPFPWLACGEIGSYKKKKSEETKPA